MALIKKKDPYQFWKFRDVRKVKIGLPKVDDLPLFKLQLNKTVKGLKSHHILFSIKDLPEALISRLKADLTLLNPEFLKSVKYGKGFVSYAVPQYVYAYSIDSKFIGLPRSTKMAYLHKQFGKYGIELEFEDIRPEFETVTFPERGVIKPWFFQIEGINQITGGNVVLKFRCGKGKCKMALMAVAKLRLRTLILVHTNILLRQWVESIQEVFDVKQEDIGIINGRTKREGLITVATEQSLVTLPRSEKRRMGQIYGHLIVDECHHMPAPKFSELMTYFKSRFLTGLSIGGKSSLLIKHEEKIYRKWISDLFSNINEGIYDVSDKNLYTRSFDFKNNRMAWKRIKTFHKYRNTKRTFRIETSKNKSIVITEDHSIFRAVGIKTNIVKSRRRRGGKIELCRGDELQKKDYLLFERKIEPVTNPIGNIYLSDYVDNKNLMAQSMSFNEIVKNIDYHFQSRYGLKINPYQQRYQWKNGGRSKHKEKGSVLPLFIAKKEGFKNFHIYGNKTPTCENRINIKILSWFLGFFVGDGSIEKNGRRISLFTNKRDLNYVKSRLKNVTKFFHVPLKPLYREKEEGIELRFNSPVLHEFLEKMFFKKKSYEKRIPEIVFSFNMDCIDNFIGGLMDSDGHLSLRGNKKCYYYTTTSYGLATDLVDLLRFKGITAGIHKKKKEKGGIVNGRIIEGRRECYVVHFSYNFYKTGLDRPDHFILNVGNTFKQLPITKIEPCQENWVYDLSVEDTENFIANGFLVHNSATPFRDDGMDPILKLYIGPIVEVDDLGGFETKIRLRKTKFKYDFIGKKDKYNDLLLALIRDNDRNQLIVDDIIECAEKGKIIVVYSNRIEHMERLQEILKKRAPNIPSDILASEVGGIALSPDGQEAIKQKLRNQEIRVLFGGKIVEEGFDCPPLSAAFLATPTKSRRLVEQLIGRCQREYPGKKEAVLVDYIDEQTKILLYQFFSKNKRFYRNYIKIRDS